MTKQPTQPTASAPESSTDDDTLGSPTRIHRVSPWPPFVAFGFAVAEIGIVLNFVTLAIGGIVLFGGSVAGILSETKYVRSPWRTLLVLGSVFVTGGAAISASQVDQFTLEVLLSSEPVNAIAMRGEAIIIAGLVLLLGSVVGRLTRSQRTRV